MIERCTDCVAGYVNIIESEERCSTCLGYARLYPPALVERVAQSLAATLFDAWFELSENLKGDYRKQAVSVLGAINREAP